MRLREYLSLAIAMAGLDRYVTLTAILSDPESPLSSGESETSLPYRRKARNGV